MLFYNLLTTIWLEFERYFCVTVSVYDVLHIHLLHFITLSRLYLAHCIAFCHNIDKSSFYVL